MSKDKLYSGDGTGCWWCTEYKPRCIEEIVMWGQCVRVEGHEGLHWLYKDDGSYCYADPAVGGGAMIPPGNKDWVSPVDTIDQYYLAFKEHYEVTDPELLAKLNNGEEVDGIVDEPVSEEDLDEMIREGVFPENIRTMSSEELMAWRRPAKDKT